MKKKVWEKPRLIVLFRGRPEERVLGACKIDGDNGPFGSGSGGCKVIIQGSVNVCFQATGT